MRPVIALVIFAGAILAACSSGGSTATPTPESAASEIPSPQDTDCNLGPAPTTTHAPGAVRNGWNTEYDQGSIIDDPTPADAIIRGRVLHVVRTEGILGFDESACVWVEQVIRGKNISGGSTIVVNKPSPFVFESAPFSDEIAFSEGVEYILRLHTVHSDLLYKRTPSALADFYFDLFYSGYALDGPSPAPSQQAIDDLLAATTLVYDAPDLVDADLSSHGLETIHRGDTQWLPLSPISGAPGTLISPEQVRVPWQTSYHRIDDAITRAGYDWSSVISEPVLAVSLRVRRVNSDDGGVQAGVLLRDGRIVAEFLFGQEDAWPIDEYSLALAAQGVSPPSISNRAPATINLFDWFGVSDDQIRDVLYYGGDAHLTYTFFSTEERRQKLLNILNRTYETHPTAGDPFEIHSDCSSSRFHVRLKSDWSFDLVYSMPTSRLYAIQDGFYIDAPRELADLLGITQFTPSDCQIPSPIQ